MIPNEKIQAHGKKQLINFSEALSDALRKNASPEIIATRINLINIAGLLYCPHDLVKVTTSQLHFIAAYTNNRCSQCGEKFNVVNLKLTTHGCLCVLCHDLANQPQQDQKK